GSDSFQPEAKVRCICSSTMVNDSMIQCEDQRCQVWQHLNCVLIPDKPGESAEVPPVFYCELCRLSRAD
uniref:E3 SUMO-protein ligase SIZ1 n=1 Tax=Oryza sativa subsp. japonica TaxID=39947 RepID=UPI0002782C0A|nr:Chain A, E3 SUMO-protein ligase SIZ1 [Oryza sativa Japonica Group]